MASKTVGVQARVKEVAPTATNVLCNIHILNFSIATACRLSDIRNMIDSLDQVYIFFIHHQTRFLEFTYGKNQSTRLPNATKLTKDSSLTWDRNTRIQAHGLLKTVQSSEFIASFLVAK